MIKKLNKSTFDGLGKWPKEKIQLWKNKFLIECPLEEGSDENQSSPGRILASMGKRNMTDEIVCVYIYEITCNS